MPGANLAALSVSAAHAGLRKQLLVTTSANEARKARMDEYRQAAVKGSMASRRYSITSVGRRSVVTEIGAGSWISAPHTPPLRSHDLRRGSIIWQSIAIRLFSILQPSPATICAQARHVSTRARGRTSPQPWLR